MYLLIKKIEKIFNFKIYIVKFLKNFLDHVQKFLVEL